GASAASGSVTLSGRSQTTAFLIPRVTITFRQRGQFLVERPQQVVPVGVRPPPGLTAWTHRRQPPSPPPLGPSGGQPDPPGHPEQPPADRRRGRVPGQHQERRLEGVFRQLRVPRRPPAHPEHHHPVPPHQRRERGLV